MSKTYSLSLFLTIGLSAWSVASAAPAQVLMDSQGMPFCVVDGDSKAIVKFAWNNDPYVRPIMATSFSASSDSELRKTIKAECSKRTFIAKASPEITSSLTVKEKSYDILSDEASSYKDVTLDADVKERLAQVRLGGNLYRPLEIRTADKFFSAKAMPEFTKNLNRDLTRKYGIGFAGDVYREFLMTKPENRNINEAALKNMESYVSDPSFSQAIHDRFRNVTFVLVKGYAHDRDDDNRISPVANTLRGFGFDVMEFTSNPYGRTFVNDDVIAEQIEAAIKAGKQLIISSGSAATTQALGAISMLNKRFEGKINSAYSGKVLAYLNLSGVVGGAFLPEALGSNPIVWLAIKNKVRDLVFGTQEELEQMKVDAEKMASGEGKDLAVREIARYERRIAYKPDSDSLESFRDLSVKRTTAYMKDVLPNLPKDVVYYNLVGINKGDGIVKDPSTSILQTKYIRGQFAQHFDDIGANDGFIEYPGTQLTTKMIPNGRIFSLVFDSSHIILDGKFNHYPLLNNFNNQKGVIGSVLMTLADKLDL